MSDPKPKVFLVDDHDLFRAGVRSEIGDAVEIVGDADDVDAAIEMIVERQPDVVLLDVHMPGGGGRAVLEAVHTENPHIQFLALSVSDAPEDVVDIVHASVVVMVFTVSNRLLHVSLLLDNITSRA